MNEKLTFKTFRADDISGLAGLLKNEYPDGEIGSKPFLEWEYIHNPFGKAVVTLVKDEQQIPVSQYAVIPWQVSAGGKTVEASLSLNTITAEPFRGKGLFTRAAEATFGECAASGIYFTIGIPNKHSYPGFTGKLGFTHSGNLHFLAKPLRPFQVFQSLVSKGSLKKGQGTELVFDDSLLVKQSVTRFHPEQDSVLYELFWERCKQRNFLAVNRTPEYLMWRYFKNPLRKYDVFKIVEGGEMKALCAVRSMNIFGMKACVVMDFLSVKDASGFVLLNTINSELKRNQLDIVIASAAGKREEYALLRNAGFYQVPRYLLPQQLPFIIRMHKPFGQEQSMSNLNNWHFSFGDYDIF